MMDINNSEEIMVEELNKQIQQLDFDTDKINKKMIELEDKLKREKKFSDDLEKEIEKYSKENDEFSLKITNFEENHKIFDILKSKNSNINTYITAKSLDKSVNKHLKRNIPEQVLISDKTKLVKDYGTIFSSLEDAFSINQNELTSFSLKLNKLKDYNSLTKSDTLGEGKSVDSKNSDLVTKKSSVEIYLVSKRNNNVINDLISGNNKDNGDDRSVYNKMSVINYNQSNIDIDLTKTPIIDISNKEMLCCSYISYDHLFNVHDEGKFSISKIKNIACNYFGINQVDYIIINLLGEIVPFDLILYKELFKVNLDMGYINKTDKFFMMRDEVLTLDCYKFVLLPYSLYCNCVGNDYSYLKIMKLKEKSKIIIYFILKLLIIIIIDFNIIQHL